MIYKVKARIIDETIGEFYFKLADGTVAKQRGSVHGRGVIFGGIGGEKTCRSWSGAGVVTAAGGLGWSCSTSH